MEQYKGYRVSEINGYKNTLSFTNGVTLYAGEVQGDISEEYLRRIQIRETIKSHFERERVLYNRGIKVLSLFFIDEVAKYRKYNENGDIVDGEYGKVFKEEYINSLNEYITLFDDPYTRYLKKINVEDTHNGYFSIDKTGRMKDSKAKGKEKISDDESAYDLIMRDKERLLSLDEPTRFVFSHSALREGWDNPNVFQICTLKHSDSTMRKRQEVGRGLRLCINQEGVRIDGETPGVNVHDINILTVIASESYENFAKQLQSEIAETLSERPRKVDEEFFLNNLVKNSNDEELLLNKILAKKLYHFFIKSNYIDTDDYLTEDYYKDLETNNIQLPEEFQEFKQGILQLVSKIYSSNITELVGDGRKENITEMKLNENYKKREFKELWNKINIKTSYYVDFNSEELIKNSVIALDKDLRISDLTYHIKIGEMENILSKNELENGESFKIRESEMNKEYTTLKTTIKYDIVGQLVNGTKLIRSDIVQILKKINPNTFYMFRKNPEEFILKASRIINQQKASMIIEHITYNPIGEVFGSTIFTDSTLKGTLGKDAIAVKRHIYDYVKYDSELERKFAEELDNSSEVCVYAKLPRGFFIPTPVGNYNPDWAIVFNENGIKHIYFIAETKGMLNSFEIRTDDIESAKIHCAKEHFKKISNETVRYEAIGNYEMLMEKVMR
ncbi:restriction endonuclease [Tissierella creatinophila]